jgi:hypothetical protein
MNEVNPYSAPVLLTAPSRRRPNRLAVVSTLLTALLILGIGVAVLASAADVESIVVTGPLLSVLGIGVAVFWRAPSQILLGLSVPLLSVAVFLLIFLQSWGPSTAQRTVTAILLGYEFAILPLGLWAFYGALVQMLSGLAPLAPATRQFSIRGLLLVTLLVGIDMAIVRVAMRHGDAHIALAIGLMVLGWMALPATFALATKRVPMPIKSLESDAARIV